MIPGNFVAVVVAFALGALVMDFGYSFRNQTFIPVPPMRSELAPIKPHCPERSPGWIAKQPDGGGWSVHCLKGIRA